MVWNKEYIKLSPLVKTSCLNMNNLSSRPLIKNLSASLNSRGSKKLFKRNLSAFPLKMKENLHILSDFIWCRKAVIFGADLYYPMLRDIKR